MYVVKKFLVSTKHISFLYKRDFIMKNSNRYKVYKGKLPSVILLLYIVY